MISFLNVDDNRFIKNHCSFFCIYYKLKVTYITFTTVTCRTFSGGGGLLSKPCYKTRSCLDLKNKKKGEKKKRKNGSYHFEFSTKNEKLVVHASALRRTSVCDKLTKKKKNTLIDIQSERFPRGTKIAVSEPTKNI